MININGDRADAAHYNRTIALVGSIDAVAERLVAVLESGGLPAARTGHRGSTPAQSRRPAGRSCARSAAAPPRWTIRSGVDRS